jgi:hypothetical protein
VSQSHQLGHGPRQSLTHALFVEWQIRPMATSMTIASVVTGICALVLGPHASRAFTIIVGGRHGVDALIARGMGAFLAIGGLLVVAGVVRYGSFIELLGLGCMSAGAFIYGVGVLIGLGINGLIAGLFALGLSLGAALRVVLLAFVAKKLYEPPPRQ